jgi:hypothetical protein
MRTALLVTIAIATLVGGSAQAGWKDTNWGMSAGQLAAIYPEAVETSLGDYSSHLSLKGPVFFGGAQWESVWFLFDTAGRLRAVRLYGSSSFQTLRDSLASQLGPPVILEEGRPGLPGLNRDKAIFRDKDRQNTIRLESIRSSMLSPVTNLYYERASADF